MVDKESNIIYIFATNVAILTMSKYRLLTSIIITALSTAVSSQTVSLKTNLLYDVTLTPNIGLEQKIDSLQSIQLFYGIHPWRPNATKRLCHWSLMPEYRRWIKEPFHGHFIGIHALGGEYNIAGIGLRHTLRTYHYEGWYLGTGLTYGYTWQLSKYWNLEAAIGMGFIHIMYDKYENQTCGRPLNGGHCNYIGPTKLALSIAYLLGNKKDIDKTSNKQKRNNI